MKYIYILIQIYTDYKYQSDPVPQVSPQSHLVQARIDPDYYVANANGFEINSFETVYNNQLVLQTTLDGTPRNGTFTKYNNTNPIPDQSNTTSTTTEPV